MRAWRRRLGQRPARIVVENGYVDVTRRRHPPRRLRDPRHGRFSLGYPRRDGGEEINARIRIVEPHVTDLRHAFELDDYPCEGLLTGEFHIYGPYQTPFGFGKMTIDAGVAYGETFETATASLRFEGAGVRLDAIDVAKGGGTMTGAAFVGWDGTYSFNVDARRIPMETMQACRYPKAPLSG